MVLDTDIPRSIPPLREVPHYHGDALRTLFVTEATLLIVAAATGAQLALSPTTSVGAAIALVVAAGITNPAQHWIHYANGLLAALGAIIFGVQAVGSYPMDMDSSSFVFALALALISLVALYLATRTIRGLLLRDNF